MEVQDKWIYDRTSWRQAPLIRLESNLRFGDGGTLSGWGCYLHPERVRWCNRPRRVVRMVILTPGSLSHH
jgi:hypothetical protein